MPFFQERWTEVRHKQTQRRNRDWDRGRGMDYRMDRAPPVFSGTRAPFPPPNQPVPPVGPSRFLGPQSRSYAAVVRGNDRRHGYGFPPRTRRVKQGRQQPTDRGVGSGFPPRPRNIEQRQQPTDPGFGRLVRKMHSVIKMVHHIQNVSPKPGKPEPPMISRMVDVLSSMIKPASPTESTMDLIRGNAKNWGYNTLLILEEHYVAGMEILLEDLSNELVADWKPAFEVATRWARRNLPRLTRDSVDHAEALIAASRVVAKEAAPQGEAVALEDPSEQAQGLQPTQDAPQWQTVRPGVQPQVPQQAPTSRIVTSGDVRGQDAGSTFLLASNDPPLEQRQPHRIRSRNNCVVRDEQVIMEIEEVEKSTQESSQVPARGSGQSLLDMNLMDMVSLLSPLQDSTTPKQGFLGSQQVTAQVHQREEDLSDSLQEDTSLQQTSIPGPQDGRDNGEGDAGDVLQEDESPVGTSTSRPQYCKVTKHISTERKMIDWGLSVGKKWLFIGDSNLARFPAYAIPDLQVESYPGANFRHAQALMAKASKHVKVEKLVLSFGINCRTQRAKETSIKQMQAAVKAARQKFQGAEIWIPVVNYSKALPWLEQASLQLLNNHIERNMPYIPALESTDFQTERDNVHWTRDTARAMFRHWIDCLNLHPR